MTSIGTDEPLARPRLRVLGPIELTAATGEAVPLEGRLQRRLLAALLLVSPRSLSVDRLSEVLWEDEPPADPRGGLQVQVSRLRSRLRAAGAPAETLVTESTGYRIDAAALELDAVGFERALEAARNGFDAPDAARRDLTAALALWRGAAYEDLATLRLPSGETARLEELRVAARELAAELSLAAGAADAAIAELESLAAEDPLRERCHALLAEALYRQGRGAEGLGVLQRFGRRLSEELGIDPSPALRQLELRLVRHEMPGAPVASPSSPSSPSWIPRAEISPPAIGPSLAIEYLRLPDGRDLAFATAGEGPTLVIPPAFVTHLDALAEAEDPRSRFFAALATCFRIVLWDRYGTGLSQGDLPAPDLTATVECIAVLDHLGLATVPLLAVSSAGPTALSLAARHPERVSALVLLGTFASGAATFGPPDVLASIAGLARAHWGIGSKVLTDVMFPGCSPELVGRMARLQQRAASAETAARILEAMYRVELRASLPAVAAPALVIHYLSDRAIPFRGGRELAAGLPNARLVPLHGVSHLPTDADVERVVEWIQRFVGSADDPDADTPDRPRADRKDDASTS